MKIKNILKIASIFINLEKEFKDIIEDADVIVNEEIQAEFDVLLKALNLAYLGICDYVPITRCKEIEVGPEGEILFSSIDENIKEILKIKDAKFNRNVKYLECEGCLVLKSKPQKISILYSAYPETLTSQSELNFFNGKVSEKCFALAVAAEYFYIKAFYDEAEMYDKRFKDILRIETRRKTPVFIPKRRWK